MNKTVRVKSGDFWKAIDAEIATWENNPLRVVLDAHDKAEAQRFYNAEIAKTEGVVEIG